MRIGKGGKKVVINASYNPITDEKGHVIKVVKFATDVTDRVYAVDSIRDGLKRMASGDLSFPLKRALPQILRPCGKTSMLR